MTGSEQGAQELWSEPLGSPRILPHHLERLAMVYVRQSTLQQTQKHQESTKLQYGLVQRALRLGWPKERIVVIDDDLGCSGSSAEGRPGFQRLVAEVGLGHVGIILGVEVSRLARSCRDWHQLLEVCALFGALICDLDGVYDPSQYNDRLVLGLKGTASEVELHLIKQRMNTGSLHKARRGELEMRVPMGYIRRPSGEIVKDPDEQVQSIVELIFAQFAASGTIQGVLQYLVLRSVMFSTDKHPFSTGQIQRTKEHPLGIAATEHHVALLPQLRPRRPQGRKQQQIRFILHQHQRAGRDPMKPPSHSAFFILAGRRLTAHTGALESIAHAMEWPSERVV